MITEIHSLNYQTHPWWTGELSRGGDFVGFPTLMEFYVNCIKFQKTLTSTFTFHPSETCHLDTVNYPSSTSTPFHPPHPKPETIYSIFPHFCALQLIHVCPNVYSSEIFLFHRRVNLLRYSLGFTGFRSACSSSSSDLDNLWSLQGRTRLTTADFCFRKNQWWVIVWAYNKVESWNWEKSLSWNPLSHSTKTQDDDETVKIAEKKVVLVVKSFLLYFTSVFSDCHISFSLNFI